jgi:hypothetical protein
MLSNAAVKKSEVNHSQMYYSGTYYYSKGSEWLYTIISCDIFTYECGCCLCVCVCVCMTVCMCICEYVQECTCICACISVCKGVGVCFETGSHSVAQAALKFVIFLLSFSSARITGVNQYTPPSVFLYAQDKARKEMLGMAHSGEYGED